MQQGQKRHIVLVNCFTDLRGNGGFLSFIIPYGILKNPKKKLLHRILVLLRALHCRGCFFRVDYSFQTRMFTHMTQTAQQQHDAIM